MIDHHISADEVPMIVAALTAMWGRPEVLHNDDGSGCNLTTMIWPQAEDAGLSIYLQLPARRIKLFSNERNALIVETLRTCRRIEI